MMSTLRKKILRFFIDYDTRDENRYVAERKKESRRRKAKSESMRHATDERVKPIKEQHDAWIAEYEKLQLEEQLRREEQLRLGRLSCASGDKPKYWYAKKIKQNLKPDQGVDQILRVMRAHDKKK